MFDKDYCISLSMHIMYVAFVCWTVFFSSCITVSVVSMLVLYQLFSIKNLCRYITRLKHKHSTDFQKVHMIDDVRVIQLSVFRTFTLLEFSVVSLYNKNHRLFLDSLHKLLVNQQRNLNLGQLGFLVCALILASAVFDLEIVNRDYFRAHDHGIHITLL